MLLALSGPAELFQLPITNPVLIFAIAMTTFLVAPLLFERLRVPGIIGLIVTGAVVGPNGLGWLERDETIILLGTVGILYLMFVAGIEIDLHGFNRNRNRSLGFGVITFVIPQTLGTAVGLFLGYPWPASILLGSMLASHTLVAYPIASRLGISKNTAVTAAVGGTILTDLVALLVLAVIAASVEGEMGAAFWTRLIVSLAIFTGVVMLGLPRLARWFFRHEEDGETGAYIFVLASLFAAAVLAEMAGVEAIIGAFLAGLALNRLIPEGSPLSNRIHFFGNAVFIPFFLFSVGMLVDVRVFTGGREAWIVMGMITGAVITGKWLAAWLTQRVYGYTSDEGWTIFGLSAPQAAATLAAALIGHQLELFDTNVLNAAVMMMLVTCTLGPWAVERFGRRVALMEEMRPYAPAEAPQRILIPIAKQERVDALLDLAFLVRAPGSDEPLRPLTVVPPDGNGAAARVASAEKLLREAAVYAAGAEIPVNPLTRVDRHVAGGIIRGMAESRTTAVEMGWDGRRDRRNGILDDVHDQLLERTDQLMLVARVNQPLNTTRRIVLILPPHVARSRGFGEAVGVIKAIASRMAAPMHAMVVGGSVERYGAHLASVAPEIPTELQAVAGWDDLPRAIEEAEEPDDLVVLLGARRGTIAWERSLDGLPRALASVVGGNLLVVFPSEVELEAAPRVGPEISRTLTPERAILGMPGVRFREAVEQLLARQIEDGPARQIADRLARAEADAATQVAPGVVFTSAVTPAVDEPTLFLATSAEGIEVAGAADRARLFFLFLVPPACRHEQLHYLAEVTRLVRSEERRERLCQCESTDTMFDWFRPEAPPGTPSHANSTETSEEAAGVVPVNG